MRKILLYTPKSSFSLIKNLAGAYDLGRVG